jgi:hypothetical protein
MYRPIRLILFAALLVASLPLSAHAQQFRQFCVVVHLSLANLTYLPQGSSVEDCATLARALAEQPPRLAPNTQYELGCQFGGLALLTNPRPWNNLQVVGDDWLKVGPNVDQQSAYKCADTWHVPHTGG